MDWEAAIHYARLVLQAELVLPTQVSAQELVVPRQGVDVRYDVLLNIFANDLATESNVSRRELIVSIGFVAQDDAGHVVLAIRGTHGIHEWLHDCRYGLVPCPFADAGKTEDGFTEMYMSLRVDAAHGSQRLRPAVAALRFPRAVRSVTVCGHSLGAALATLLALDLAANTQYKDLALYNFASPRTGDDRFAEVFGRLVPHAFRIANRLDLVTEVPPGFLVHEAKYRHVEATAVLVPDAEIEQHLLCMHHLSTYLHLMAIEGKLDAAQYPVVQECLKGLRSSWMQRIEHRVGLAGHADAARHAAKP